MPHETNKINIILAKIYWYYAITCTLAIELTECHQQLIFNVAQASAMNLVAYILFLFLHYAGKVNT